MSQQRRKRLEHLEAIARRRGPETPYVDPFKAARVLLAEIEAIKAGRACALPVPEPEPMDEATQDAFDRTMAQLDTMHVRLTAPDVA